MCITKTGSENREAGFGVSSKKRRKWGMSYFQDASPESLGISSGGILRFLDRMEKKNIELHSFMVVRHGKCAAKGWWKPYAPDAAPPAVFLWQNPDGNGNRVLHDRKKSCHWRNG